MAAAAVSPSSSPRLPSPPPIAEDQLGPTSPGIPMFDDHGRLPASGTFDSGASRRIRKGTKAEDMAEGPALVELQDIDSAFQLTEHLKALYYARTHPEKSTMQQPLSAEAARELAQPPAHTSRDIWLYELGRLLIDKTNAILVALFADTPPCSSSTCPEMRASEWQYLCAVHDPPKSCAAIDYCCHTLDWAAATLTSSKMFPSRLGLGSGAVGMGDKVLQLQMKEIKNIFRRVYRIYAHAWFQHREMFWRVESRTGLYALFKTVCDEYGIIESENYTIPPEAEGGEPAPTPTQSQSEPQPQPMSVLKREQDFSIGPKADDSEDSTAGQSTAAPGDASKRHRHSMSDRSVSVSTVIQEEVEEEEEEEEERPESVPFKPKLGRTGTALPDFIPIATATEVPAEEDESEDLMSGAERSEVLTLLEPSEKLSEDVEKDVSEAKPAIEESETKEAEASSGESKVEDEAAQPDSEGQPEVKSEE